MAETAFSHSQVESPADGAVVAPGRLLVQGWVWPKAGGVFADIRARVGGRIFPGVHGIPRRDLAAHFQTGKPVALAEFSVAVELESGLQTILLDALAIEGRWRTFHQLTLQVDSSRPRETFAVPAARLRWIDYGHGLRLLLRECGRRPGVAVNLVARELVAELPASRILRDAPAPLHGFVDEPAVVCCSRFGRIPAFGHLFHPELKTRRILASTDLQAWQPLEIHRPSPGPAAHYRDWANARDCGFVGLVDVPAQLPNPVSLRIYVELEDGSLHLGPVVSSRLHPADVEKSGLAARDGLAFAEAKAAWDAALGERRLAAPNDSETERFLADLAAEHDDARRAGLPRPVPRSATAPRPPALSPRSILLATHGLSLQGAPRFLLELAQACAADGARVVVVTAEDGPLRAEFEALGAEIRVVATEPLAQAGSPAAAHAAVTALAAGPHWRTADLVVANSFTTYWAVHAGKIAGRPVVMYVHESTSPRQFFDRRISPAALALVESAFALADAVSFTTASTRDVHLGRGHPERYRLTPGWAQLDRLDAWLAAADSPALRRELGVADGEQLVCNIGTISDRKGQHTFARAVDLLWRRHPAIARRSRFILLGGRDTPFDRMLQDVLGEFDRPNLIAHAETTDYLRYYLAADVFACSSYEESSPRVIFEAMACRVPIIASDVHGIPELVRPDLEASLVPAGDTAAWCDALARRLAAPGVGAELAARARARVESTYRASAILPRHRALLAEVAGTSVQVSARRSSANTTNRS